MTRLPTLMVALALMAAACGDTTTTTQAPATTGAPTTTSTQPATTPAPTTTAPTTSAPSSTTTEATTTTAGWVGEPFDFWVPIPEEGPIVGVFGVRADDTLNVRSGPGIAFDIIAELDPTFMGIAGTGNGWQLPSGSVWWEIEVGSVTGWANQRYLSRFGDVDDITSQIVARYGAIPGAETMLDLGLLVAEVVAPGDEEVTSEIVVAAGPTVGDLGEIIIDIVGLADDSVGGFRLHIFGQPVDPAAGFSLMAVESWLVCQRGVTDGICV